jgi:hypothetical protein
MVENAVIIMAIDNITAAVLISLVGLTRVGLFIIIVDNI